MELEIERLLGAQMEPHLRQVAQMRLEVFREFPYLYQGDLAYEEKYLEGFAQARDALLLVASQGQRLLGVSTSMALAESTDILESAQEALEAHGVPVEACYYYGEILVKPQHRGLGIAGRFYREREALARARGYRQACFATVVRQPDDPRRDASYFDPSPYWNKMGFVKAPQVAFSYRWPTRGLDGQVRDEDHQMVFWFKAL